MTQSSPSEPLNDPEIVPQTSKLGRHEHAAIVFVLILASLIVGSQLTSVAKLSDDIVWQVAFVLLTILFFSGLAGALALNRLVIWRARSRGGLSSRDQTPAEAESELSEQYWNHVSAQAHAILEAAMDGFVVIDEQALIQLINPAIERIFGYSSDELIGKNVKVLMPEPFREEHDTYLSDYLETGRRKIIGIGREVSGRRKGGAVFPLDLTVTEMKLEHGRFFVGTIRDISESKRTEEELRTSQEQLLQAQKMEAIGRLAGGIAHDFNTVLGTVLGYSEMLQEALEPNDGLQRAASQIESSAKRGAALTKQLLNFSRHHLIEKEAVRVDHIIDDMIDMLQRLSGDDVEILRVESAYELGWIEADAQQIEQILMNLVVNACDALPRGGTVSIRTSNVNLVKKALPAGGPLQPGPHVLVEISDTGNGMSEETLEKLFEPFFTTKAPGEGTGLGLSVVYGIVKQSGGHISVESAPGCGATFRIYLPRIERPQEPDRTATPMPREPDRRVKAATVLIVEDDEMFRGLLCEVLEAKGYTAIGAGGPAEALALCKGGRSPIDLIVSDVVMPGGMMGNDLGERVAERFPQIRVILISGHADPDLAKRGFVDSGGIFLHKPFSTTEFLSTVARVLGESAN